MNKSVTVSLGVAILLIGGSIAYISNTQCRGGACSAPSVDKKIEGIRPEVIDGVQIIEITAKGGYAPRRTVAKAGIPTTIRVRTNGTFDCSSSLLIPQLNYHKLLPSSGVEDIEIPASDAKGTLRGLCSMGMYNFEIDFE